MQPLDKPNSVDLRVLSTFKYELLILDIKIKNATTSDEEKELKTIKSYFENRISAINCRL